LGEASKRAIGDRVIAKVNEFRQQKGRLPSSLSEIGTDETESGPIYYERRGDTRYIVWYGTRLGESVTYDSDVGRWEAHN